MNKARETLSCTAVQRKTSTNVAEHDYLNGAAFFAAHARALLQTNKTVSSRAYFANDLNLFICSIVMLISEEEAFVIKYITEYIILSVDSIVYESPINTVLKYLTSQAKHHNNNICATPTRQRCRQKQHQLDSNLPLFSISSNNESNLLQKFEICPNADSNLKLPRSSTVPIRCKICLFFKNSFHSVTYINCFVCTVNRKQIY